MEEIINSFLGSAVAVAVVAFLGREWLTARLRIALEMEFKTSLAAAEIKRTACLEALQVADAALANLEWHGGMQVEHQHLSIEKARDCYNKLALVCDGQEVLQAYLRVLAVRSPGEPVVTVTADAINDLRNAMRKELGFGKNIDLPADKVWIASLQRAGS
jgi:hypothetical protein